LFEIQHTGKSGFLLRVVADTDDLIVGIGRFLKNGVNTHLKQFGFVLERNDDADKRIVFNSIANTEIVVHIAILYSPIDTSSLQCLFESTLGICRMLDAFSVSLKKSS